MSKLQGRNLVGLFVALTLAAGSASATNGYYTTGTGTKSKGQAGAGSANPQELMSLATNPAGIAFVDEAIEAEAQAQAICMATNDFHRAYHAFVAKEKPQFEGD